MVAAAANTSLEFHNKINRGSPAACWWWWGRQCAGRRAGPTQLRAACPARLLLRPTGREHRIFPPGFAIFSNADPLIRPLPRGRGFLEAGQGARGGAPRRDAQNLNLCTVWGSTGQAGTGAGWSLAKWVLYYSTVPPV